MVAGPGLIVMVADNDAGAVSTYTEAGYRYGTKLLWLLLLLLPCTYFVQEMVARLGIATGQGHAAMIYKRFGKWWGIFSLVDLEVVNFLTMVTEFAAINLVATKLGISPFIAVPVVASGLIIMVCTASYRRWERITIFLCALDLAWLGYAVYLGPSAGAVAHAVLVPQLPAGGVTSQLLFLVIAIVGTTIAPWQLFFQQSCVADKRLRFADLTWERIDTLVGAVIVIVVAGCMMLAGDAARRLGLSVTHYDPAQMAVFLGKTYGPLVQNGLLLLMCNAAILGTTAISLSSAWAYGEVKGWPSSLELSVKQAPGFYALYALAVGLAAAIVLIPDAPLQLIILGVQVLAGIMLPSAIIFLQLLLNDRELLGDYVNTPWNNVVNWTIIIVLFALSLTLAAQVVAPNLFPRG
ncbi:MAG TPA: Nramp family divalent metal transporter [Armatimonadota bacterium]|jgi:NRAMP (natural resistance-associated macrophage protein)-like metal ion transporter